MVERLPRLLHLVADDLAIQPHGFDSHLGIVSLGAGFAPLSATYWLQSRAASAAHRTVFFGARPRMDPGTCAKTSWVWLRCSDVMLPWVGRRRGNGIGGLGVVLDQIGRAHV